MSLKRILGVGGEKQAWTASELDEAFDSFTAVWPDHNDEYRGWKPLSKLPRPKAMIKEALKRAYAGWPEPIDWTIFAAFFTEYIDLGTYLPDEHFRLIDRLRKSKVLTFDKENEHDPLLLFRMPSNGLIFANTDNHLRDIERIRTEIVRSRFWDPVEISDEEIARVQQYLLSSRLDTAILQSEWLFYIHAIGRHQYVTDSCDQDAAEE